MAIRDSGYIDGKNDGIEIGKKEGIKEGEKKGKIEGKKEGILETKKEIINQMLKYNMSIENIVKITNLSKSEIEKIM